MTDPTTTVPAVPADTSSGVLRPAPARITGGVWHLRRERNGRDAIRAGHDRLEAAGNLRNLRIAAGDETGEATGPVFMDSDVHKWLEAVAWEIGRAPADDLLAMQRTVTALVAAAQDDDGYVDSVVQIRSGRDGRYRELAHSHELYCAGHLFQAAVAQVRATGDTALLDVARRSADHLVRTFGPGRLELVDGHPVVETGLVELFRETGERAYLDLAAWFVDARGHGIIERMGHDPAYFSDRVPVRDADAVEGHAVRAVYLAAGAVDVAIETGDRELLAASERQFADMLRSKTFITGGLGARWEGEAFGDPYELPTDRGYAETCAAIGAVQWAWRLLLATGDERYADAIERLLHNAFAAGVSLAGTEYFYVNPLQLRSDALADGDRSPANGRLGWFSCACCPPNVMRTLASLDGYLATTRDDVLTVHQYADAEVGPLRIETEYPLDGLVRVTVTADGHRAFGFRVPAWSDATEVRVGDDAPEHRAAGTVWTVERTWRAGDTIELRFDMTPRVYVGDGRIDAVRGQVAFERGPLVYALEQHDVDGVSVDDVLVDAAGPITSDRRDDLLDGVVTLGVPLRRRAGEGGHDWPYRRLDDSGSGSTDATDVDGRDRRDGGEPGLQAELVPYATWANRGPVPMRVWLPRAD